MLLLIHNTAKFFIVLYHAHAVHSVFSITYYSFSLYHISSRSLALVFFYFSSFQAVSSLDGIVHLEFIVLQQNSHDTSRIYKRIYKFAFFFLNQIILSVPELGCVCLNQVVFPHFPFFYVFFRLEEIILTSCSCAPRICS